MDDASKSARSDQLAGLGTALVCDVLDALGHRQSFLGPEVRAAWPCDPIAGEVVTLACEPIDGPAAEPYGALFDALHEHRHGAVLVIAAESTAAHAPVILRDEIEAVGGKIAGVVMNRSTYKAPGFLRRLMG